jgi:hypothetical protein
VIEAPHRFEPGLPGRTEYRSVDDARYDEEDDRRNNSPQNNTTTIDVSHISPLCLSLILNN